MTNPSVQAPGDLRPSHPVARFPLWVSIVVIIGILLTIAGAVISKANPTLLTNGGVVTETTRVYADYMFSRSLALAVLLLLLLAVRARRMLAGFMVLVALIQIIDIGDDLARGAFILVPGLVVFALLFLVGASRLFGQSIWRVDTWRESQDR